MSLLLEMHIFMLLWLIQRHRGMFDANQRLFFLDYLFLNHNLGDAG